MASAAALLLAAWFAVRWTARWRRCPHSRPRRPGGLSATGPLLPEKRPLGLLAAGDHQPAGSGGGRLAQPRGAVRRLAGHLHADGLVGPGAVVLHSQWSRYQRAVPPRPARGRAAAGRRWPPHPSSPPVRGGQQPLGHRRRTVPAAGYAGTGHRGPHRRDLLHRAAAGPFGLCACDAPDRRRLQRYRHPGPIGPDPGKPRESDAGPARRLPQPPAASCPARLYFRGAVLTHYDQGKWTNPAPRTCEDQGKGLVAAGRGLARASNGCGSKSPSSRWIATNCSAFGPGR